MCAGLVRQGGNCRTWVCRGARTGMSTAICCRNASLRSTFRACVCFPTGYEHRHCPAQGWRCCWRSCEVTEQGANGAAKIVSSPWHTRMFLTIVGTCSRSMHHAQLQQTWNTINSVVSYKPMERRTPTTPPQVSPRFQATQTN